MSMTPATHTWIPAAGSCFRNRKFYILSMSTYRATPARLLCTLVLDIFAAQDKHVN